MSNKTICAPTACLCHVTSTVGTRRLDGTLLNSPRQGLLGEVTSRGLGILQERQVTVPHSTHVLTQTICFVLEWQMDLIDKQFYNGVLCS